MTAPKLSVITVNLNNAASLRKTILSVISQTYKNYEYIIIDGGSTDGSINMIKEFSEKIDYWVSELDNGIYSAMNKGICKAKGEYLLFLNSGDWLTEATILSKVFDFPREADIIYGHMNFVSNKGCTIRKATNESQLSLAYFFNNSLCHPATFIARRLFNDGAYDDSFKIAADKKFFIEKIILQNCTLQQIDEIITNFDTVGITYRSENKAIIKEENDRIFAEMTPPRMVQDLVLFKSNYPDIQTLVKIKKIKLLYFVFKGLKKTNTLFIKIFRM